MADAREMFRMMQPPVGVPAGKVENTTIDGPGGQIPLRIYTPLTEDDGPYPIAMMFSSIASCLAASAASSTP